MTKPLLIFLSLVVSTLEVHSQKPIDYDLLEYSKGFPKIFFEESDEFANRLASQQDVLSNEEALKIYKTSISNVKQLFELGFVIHEGFLYDYVNDVFKFIYKDDPEAVKGVRIYLTKLTSANAYTSPDGTIMINLGLLAILEDVEELAFIIAHEVAHFTKSHALKSKKEADQLAEKSYDTEEDKILYFKLSYSRESESESDAYAIEKIKEIDEFDAMKSPNALEKLKMEITEMEPVSKSLYDITLSTDFVPDSSEIFVKHTFEDFQPEEIKNINSIFRGDVDNYSTHPAIPKRVAALKEILKLTDYQKAEGRRLDEFGESSFEKVRLASFYELSNQAIESGRYLLAFSYATYLHDHYNSPKKPYILNLMNKSLYWVSYYKEVNNLENEPDEYPVFFRSRYWLIAKYFKEIKSSDLKKLAFFTVKRYRLFMKNDDTYNFYLALHAENYLGKEAASIFFQEYKKNFPSGEYIILVNKKLSDS